MNRLQSVQSAAARLVTGTRRSEFRLHNAGAPIATLATGTPAPARRLQCCDIRSSVTLWHFAIVRYLADHCRLVADARERRLYVPRAEHAL